MRKIFIIVAGFLCMVSCERKKCRSAIVTHNGTPCSIWGIKIGNNAYPADSIPNNLKHEGAVVCVDYELYSDARTCACCGGTWAKIKSVRYPDD